MHSILSMDTPILELENSLKFRVPFKKEVFPEPLDPQIVIFTTYLAGIFISPLPTLLKKGFPLISHFIS